MKSKGSRPAAPEGCVYRWVRAGVGDYSLNPPSKRKLLVHTNLVGSLNTDDMAVNTGSGEIGLPSCTHPISLRAPGRA